MSNLKGERLMKSIKFLKQILLIFIMTIILSFLNFGEVNGALQANRNTHDKTMYKSSLNWIANIRKMETVGEAMGLNETLNEDLTASSGSNNIDVHMIRSTEYGAISILSASGYGNPKNDNVITSTTGNNTGIICATKSFEVVAGGIKGQIFIGTNERYYDTYTNNQESARVGDALGNATIKNLGCSGWHQAKYANWPGHNSYFARYMKFDYHYYGNNTNTNILSRGVVVCGTGI